jgi:hypothetical protein
MSRNTTTFFRGEMPPRIAGRKGRFKSPWNVPYNANARKTIRLELIRMAAQRVGK